MTLETHERTKPIPIKRGERQEDPMQHWRMFSAISIGIG